jgi:NADPH2:quinone reductase
MRAVAFDRFGDPGVLNLIDVPDLEVGPRELRIRVGHAAVNPADALLRSGARAAFFERIPPPYIPGMDASGVVDQIGSDVTTDLKLGDRVIAMVFRKGAGGAYAEQVTVRADWVVRAPEGASSAQGATLPLNGLTARRAVDVLNLRPGQTVAVTGAAGAVGGYAVQLAKADGLVVIADASAADEALVRSLGADKVFARGEEFAGLVRREYPDGVDAVIDAALLNESIVACVRDGGDIATVRGLSGSAERGITFIPAYVYDLTDVHASLERLRDQVEAGELTLRVARVLPGAQAAYAHELLQAGGLRGRIVLSF